MDAICVSVACGRTGLLGGLLAMEETAREGLIRELGQLVDVRFGGRIVRPLVVTLTVARRR